MSVKLFKDAELFRGKSIRMRGPTVRGSKLNRSAFATGETVHQHGENDNDARRKKLIESLHVK